MKALLAVLLLACVAAVAAVAWLGGTSAGARAVFQLVSRFTSVSIEAASVEGALVRDLRLTGVRLAMEEKEISIDRLRLLWLPHGLLSGRLLVNELSLRGVRIIDSSPPDTEPPQIAWPTVPHSLGRWEARIEHLQIEDLTYRRLQQQEPTTLTRFSAAATWQDGLLSLNGLTVDSPAGTVRGNLLAGLIRPSLKADLQLTLGKMAAGMDRFSVDTRLLPGKKSELVAGTVAMTGSKGAKPQVALTGEIGIERQTLNIRRLQVQQPGRTGEVTASGTIRLTPDQPVFDLTLLAERLNLKKETGTATDLSARASIAGTASDYRGRITLRNRGIGWQGGTVSTAFAGTDAGVTLSRIDGALVGGTIRGSVKIGWRNGLSASGTLTGEGLDPAMIDHRWNGSINMDMTGQFTRSPSGAVAGRLTGTIHDSVFQGWPLRGTIDAEASGSNILLRELALQGKGFAVEASGDLFRRIDFAATVTDLAQIVPDAAGQATARGWVQWRGKGLPMGAANITGTCIKAAGAAITAGRIVFAMKGGKDVPGTSFDLQGTLDGIRYQHVKADTLSVSLAGTVAGHTLSASIVSPEASAQLTLRGGYAGKRWQGDITHLAGQDRSGAWEAAAPAALTVAPTRVVLSDLAIQGSGGERLDLSGDIRLEPVRGTVLADWRDLRLDRANPWLEGMQVDGRSSGSVAVATTAGDRFTLAGKIAANGNAAFDGRRITFRSLLLDVDWREKGLAGNIELDLGNLGFASGKFTSPASPVMAVPAAGDVDLQWENVDLSLLRPWLPAPMELTGRLGGRVTARLLPGNKFDMLGKATVQNGVWSIQDAGHTVTTSIRSFDASWSWRDEGVRGGITLELARWGEARGTFAIPVPAALPLAVDRNTPLKAHAAGRVQELGLITAFFPGFVQGAEGNIHFDLSVGGTMTKPDLQGSLELAKAEGYIPAAGIRVSGTSLHATFSQDRVTVDSLRLVSGPGYLEGSAVLELRDGKLAEYRGSIRGNEFEALNLPELHGLVSPRLEFVGTLEQLTLRGDVLIPELQIKGETPQAPVQPSQDVVIVDAPPGEKAGKLAIYLDVGISLGERVTVKMKGIDAQLKGSVQLSGNPANLSSRGEIRVVKGRYKAYGIDLNIARGRIFYAGVALDQPTVDILALREVDDVKAGVTVGGTLQRPVVQLYAEPPMPDVDILAYVILGHPLGQSGEQATLVSQAAGALLSAGQSVALQDQLKSRLGLSTLEIQAGEREKGYMGYTPIAVGPAGAGQPPGDEIAQTTVSLGKYLTRKLYISYGRSIFTGTNIFRLRYDFSRQFQLETQAGAETGADLYYKVRFD